MGNRLSLTGASPPGPGASTDCLDDEASLSLGEDLSDSSAEFVDNSPAGAAEPGGRNNLAFAASVKDLSAEALAAVSNGQIPTQPDRTGTRICPILQNGRQVTKDFYWVLPERRIRRTTPVALLQSIADADEDAYQNVAGASPPKPPPRRACRSESSGGRVDRPKVCRRTASSVSSPATSSAASAFAPHQWRQILVQQVQSSVPGVTEDECRFALGLNSGDAQLAARFLKVEQLFRLGLAERTVCMAELESSGWCLETAGASLTDRLTD